MTVKLFAAARPFTRVALAREALAGLALASTNVPQVLGYTRIAGMPVVTGLYTLILPLVAFALFGSSRHLVVAADSATAAIFASGLSRMAPPHSDAYVALVGVVTLLVAALLLLARMFRLGFVADFLSRTVLVGFLAGVGVQIGIAVLGQLLGIDVKGARTLLQLADVVQRLPDAHLPTVAISLAVIVLVLAGRLVLPRVPVALLAVAASIATSAAFDLAGRGVAVLGPIGGGLPVFGFPRVSFQDVVVALPIAVSCVVVIVAQSAATSRAFAARHGERVDADADLLGLAAANAAASLSAAFVVNGSPTQTAMGERAGAGSQIAQLATAAVVLAVVLFLTDSLQYLPHCVLAAIVFTIAVGLVDVDALRDIRRESPGEFALALVTAAAVALVGVEQGMLLALVLSLLRHVRHSYRPHTSVLVTDASGHYVPVPATPGTQTEAGVIVYRFGADLFYANESRFADELRALVAGAPTPVRSVVVEASAITNVDYTAAASVRALCADLPRAGVQVYVARVSPSLRSDMDRHGITFVLGADRIFASLHDALAQTRRDAAAAEDRPHDDDALGSPAHSPGRDGAGG